MTPSPEKPAQPTDSAVAEALGTASALWDSLRRHLGRDLAPLTEEWVFGGKKHGWALRLKRKNRAILYLKPLDEYFRVSLAFGPKAVALACDRQLPAHVMRLIDDAVQYPEGKAVRLDIRNTEDVRVALQLAAIKLES